MTDPLRNPKDPLLKAGPAAEHELFRQIGQLCNGFPRDVIENVAGHLLINAVRQKMATWPQADREMRDQTGRLMQLLSEHYDTVSGRKKGIFPYDQVISVPLIKKQ